MFIHRENPIATKRNTFAKRQREQEKKYRADQKRIKRDQKTEAAKSGPPAEMKAEDSLPEGTP